MWALKVVSAPVCSCELISWRMCVAFSEKEEPLMKAPSCSLPGKEGWEMAGRGRRGSERQWFSLSSKHSACRHVTFWKSHLLSPNTLSFPSPQPDHMYSSLLHPCSVSFIFSLKYFLPIWHIPVSSSLVQDPSPSRNIPKPSIPLPPSVWRGSE
jgi:hypothetical protein